MLRSILPIVALFAWLAISADATIFAVGPSRTYEQVTAYCNVRCGSCRSDKIFCFEPALAAWDEFELDRLAVSAIAGRCCIYPRETGSLLSTLDGRLPLMFSAN